MLKFLHAADVHLDSPLKGLERYEGAPADEIRRACRRALENLVRLAVEESVAFVLIAGDLYDGDRPDQRTGLYFVSQMTELRAANIPVYLVAGNHDAANKVSRTLAMPENVHRFTHRRPETMRLADLGVAIHGQSFAKAAVTDDLAAAYPAAVPGMFNIGLLHTAATGREGHERYAPCTIDGLRSKQYDYWALGHVHQREVLCNDPPIVFPGNLQGRHIRETGPKGCMLVSVDDRHEIDVQPRQFDVFRWEVCRVDATGAETRQDVLDRFRRALGEVITAADGLPLAVRVEIVGPCAAHRQIAAEPRTWTDEIRSAALDTGDGSVWIEKVKTRTSMPVDLQQAAAVEGPLGELVRLVGELRVDPQRLGELLGERLDALKAKLPAELVEGPDAIGFDDSATVRDTLDQVEQMLAGRLLGRTSTDEEDDA